MTLKNLDAKSVRELMSQSKDAVILALLKLKKHLNDKDFEDLSIVDVKRSQKRLYLYSLMNQHAPFLNDYEETVMIEADSHRDAMNIISANLDEIYANSRLIVQSVDREDITEVNRLDKEFQNYEITKLEYQTS